MIGQPGTLIMLRDRKHGSTLKGLTKVFPRNCYNYHGPYRVVERLSPVHFRLRTCSRRPVSSIVHANRMKPFIDPHDRPTEPPNDVDDELFLADHDLPADSFEPNPTNTKAKSTPSHTNDSNNDHVHATPTSTTEKNQLPASTMMLRPRLS